ncbi:hypothetical protein FS837_000736 [Tulasnella sp. UAMH 9824]|nr:hypothetical protein FS837_000736 [Tulasnella sp. UAMH 9824]
MTEQRPSLDTLQVPGQLNRRLSSDFSSEGAPLLPNAPEQLGVDVPIALSTANLLGHVLDRSPSPGRERLGASSTRKRGLKALFSRPNPWLVFPITMMSAFIFAATMAPRAEIYIKLACAYHRPEYYETPIFRPPSAPAINNLALLSHSYNHMLSEASSNAAPVLPREMSLNFTHPTKPAINIPTGKTKCNSDPVVLAAVAKLTTVTTLIVGILTCLTTGWWGQLSDRRGRKFVMGCSVIGLLISEANLILVTQMRSSLPGDYWFLAASSVVDGFLGGMWTASAAAHAYLSDCTDPHARARTFSMYTGTLFIGIALGPTLGSLLIRVTGDLLTPFYLALAGHILATLYMWLVLPESLSAEDMARNRQKREIILQEQAEALRQSRRSGSWRDKLLAFKFLLTPFEPVLLFWPRKREVGQPGRGRDWNLTLIATAYGIMLSFVALSAFKTQYAIAVFGWTAEELGYWLTLVGVARAFHLVVILPILTRLLKPKASGIVLRSPMPGSPLLRASDEPSSLDPPTEALERTSRPTSPEPEFPVPDGQLPPHVAAKFDVKIARVSLVVELISDLVICLSVGPKSWTMGSTMQSFGSGFAPSIQSLSLFLTPPGENGKLFGSLAVVSALGGQVIGPAVFGSVFVATVGSFPKAIFIVATAGVVLASVALSLVQLPKPAQAPLFSAAEEQQREGLE